jgi:RNA polymerase sigma-70 factor (ECF subfamily)
MTNRWSEKQAKAINAKSLSAWSELYRSYYPALCVYAEGMTHRSDVAEDIVQEVLIDVWSSARIFGSMRELTFFLYKAVCNNSLYYLRTQKIHRGILDSLGRDAAMDDERFAESIREELLRRLHLQIESLPAERRRIIMLSLEGHSREQIAQMLDISPNTVKAQKTSAMKTLRNGLKNNPLVFFL